VVNDKPADSLTPRVEKGLLLAKQLETAKGAVMTTTDATDLYIGRTRRLFTIVGPVAVVLIVGIIIAGISYEPRNASTFILFALVVLGGFGFFMWWMLRRKVRLWNEKLAHRGDGLPAAGTQISFDANGLTIGAETFAWPTIAIDQVEITLTNALSGDTGESMAIIERLALKSGARTLALDRQMTQNGPQLVDNVWRRVRPKPAAAGARP
jgi:cytochrome bd-type quinol oxidase subunit 2